MIAILFDVIFDGLIAVNFSRHLATKQSPITLVMVRKRSLLLMENNYIFFAGIPLIETINDRKKNYNYIIWREMHIYLQNPIES